MSICTWRMTCSMWFFNLKFFGTCACLTWTVCLLETLGKLAADLQGEQHPSGRAVPLWSLRLLCCLPRADLLAAHSCPAVQFGCKSWAIHPKRWIFHGEHRNGCSLHWFAFMSCVLIFKSCSLGQRLRVFSEWVSLLPSNNLQHKRRTAIKQINQKQPSKPSCWHLKDLCL